MIQSVKKKFVVYAMKGLFRSENTEENIPACFKCKYLYCVSDHNFGRISNRLEKGCTMDISL